MHASWRHVVFIISIIILLCIGIPDPNATRFDSYPTRSRVGGCIGNPLTLRRHLQSTIVCAWPAETKQHNNIVHTCPAGMRERVSTRATAASSLCDTQQQSTIPPYPVAKGEKHGVLRERPLIEGIFGVSPDESFEWSGRPNIETSVEPHHVPLHTAIVERLTISPYPVAKKEKSGVLREHPLTEGIIGASLDESLERNSRPKAETSVMQRSVPPCKAIVTCLNQSFEAPDSNDTSSDVVQLPRTSHTREQEYVGSTGSATSSKTHVLTHVNPPFIQRSSAALHDTMVHLGIQYLAVLSFINMDTLLRWKVHSNEDNYMKWNGHPDKWIGTNRKQGSSPKSGDDKRKPVEHVLTFGPTKFVMKILDNYLRTVSETQNDLPRIKCPMEPGIHPESAVYQKPDNTDSLNCGE